MTQKTSRSTISRAVLELVRSGMSTNGIACSLAEYVVQEGRARELESILRHIDSDIREAYGISEVSAVSAHELSEAVRDQLTALFSDKDTVRLHEELDPDLVGGIRVRAQDRVFDISVATQLRRMKQQIKA